MDEPVEPDWSYRSTTSWLRASRASTIPPEKIEWLWPGRIAIGKLSIIAGDPGLGKSQLTLDIAARVTRSAKWPVDNTSAPSGSVLIVSAEDDAADTIVPRLIAADADRSRVDIADVVVDVTRDVDRSLSIDRDCDLVEDFINNRMDDCRLVIIDPISAYMGGADSHKNADTRAVLSRISQMAQRCRVAVIAVSHLNKGGGSNGAYRIIGSIAFAAAARAVYLVAKDDEQPNRRLFLPIKNNLGEDESGLAYAVAQSDGVPFIRWESEAVTIPANDVLDPELDDKRSAREEAKDFLETTLADGPVNSKDVLKDARAAGISDKTLRRAKSELGIKAGKRGFADGWFWSLDHSKVAKESEDDLSQDVGIFGVSGHLGDGNVYPEDVIQEAVHGLGVTMDEARSWLTAADLEDIQSGALPVPALRHFIQAKVAQ